MAKHELKRAHDEEADGGAKVAKKAGGGDVSASKRKTSLPVEPTKGQDQDGNTYWEISKTRRVGISHFKNSTLVNIREYYESAGQMRPGKKGISLSLEQYQALVRAVPFINAALQDDGANLTQLLDDGASAPAAGDKAESAAAATKKARKDKAKKANIDATSDEDSS